MQYFLTLTLDPKVIPDQYKDRTQKYITDLFNTLLTNIRRKLKGKEILKYVWVMEFQQLNTHNAHMHIALNTRLDIREVRKIWTRIGGAVQMRVDPIRNIISTSYYMSKYMTKSVADIESSRMYHFEKRYAISQSCIRPDRTAKSYHPELEVIDKVEELKKEKLFWVYTMLAKDQFVHGEVITNELKSS